MGMEVVGGGKIWGTAGVVWGGGAQWVLGGSVLPHFWEIWGDFVVSWNGWVGLGPFGGELGGEWGFGGGWGGQGGFGVVWGDVTM